jgi:uncharacterized membrane protein
MRSDLLWPQLAGLAFLVAGLVAVRGELSFRPSSWPALGRVFVAVALAAFGAEHLTSAKVIMQVVPPWMPARLFWTYFVGCAEIAAAASIVSMKHVRLSASLLGIMFFLFVLAIHVPNALHSPHDRFMWALVFRDFSFGLGASALAASRLEDGQAQNRPAAAGGAALAALRVPFALVLLFYGVEHLLHPDFTPGVPLSQLTAAWIPLRPFWGYLTGAALVIGGVLLLINRWARPAATWLGVEITLIVLLINVPMRVAASTPAEIITAVNYIGDTLLFAGAIFLVAAALPAASGETSAVRQAA